MLNNHQPLISVICTCFNHEKYVEQAITSVKNQTYQNVELIVIDNASKDNSQAIILNLKNLYGFQHIFNETNIGLPKAFNAALKISKGKYIIDLSADDVLLSFSIEEQVKEFQKSDINTALIYSDAIYIDQNNKELYLHSKKYPFQPSGFIFKDIIFKYFICPPSIIFNRTILEKLGGYDESLLYEDFDYWVKSSRDHPFQYINKPLVYRRLSGKKAFSNSFYKFKSPLAESTFIIIKKAFHLCQTNDEFSNLYHRSLFESRQCVFLGHYKIAKKYIDLANQICIKNPNIKKSFKQSYISFCANNNIYLYPLYKIFHFITGK